MCVHVRFNHLLVVCYLACPSVFVTSGRLYERERFELSCEQDLAPYKYCAAIIIIIISSCRFPRPQRSQSSFHHMVYPPWRWRWFAAPLLRGWPHDRPVASCQTRQCRPHPHQPTPWLPPPQQSYAATDSDWLIIVLSHLVQLVNADHTPIRQHHGSPLHHKVTLRQ